MQESVFQKVSVTIAELLALEPAKVTLDSRLADDLGADSLDSVELIMAFEEEFGIEISDEDVESLKTVSDIVEFIEERQAALR